MSDLSVLEDSDLVENQEKTTTPRKSLSQPSLVDSSTTPKASTSQTDQKLPKTIPIIQTWRENEELKGQMYTLRCEVQMYEHRYLVAKNTMHQSVQDVLDDYVKLKLKEDDMDEKIEEFHELNQQLITLREQLEDSNSKIIERDEEIKKIKLDFERKLKETEEHFNSIITNQPQTTTNESMLNSTAGTIRPLDLKQGDPNFTITTWEDKRILELEYKLMDEQEKVAELEKICNNLREDLDDKSARLADTENQKAQLIAAAGGGILGAAGADVSKTFVLGNAQDSLISTDQLKYIDELETNLKESKDDLIRTTTALGEYMNKVSRLEKEIMALKKNMTFETSSMLFEGKTAEELRVQITKVNTELNELRSENRDLRSRCHRLKGGDGRVSISFDEGSRRRSTMFEEDISRAHATRGETTSTDENMMTTSPEQGMTSSSSPETVGGAETGRSSNYLMNSSTSKRIDEEDDRMFADAVAEFENMMMSRNDTVESSFSNSTMPPPDKSQTELYLRLKDQHQQKSANNSFASRTSSAVTTIPAHESGKTMREEQLNKDVSLVQELQQILDSSQVLIEGSQNAVADIEKMREQMSSARNALGKLFERLKSSAALFEEILEKMGSSSPLAEKIRQMKLAFETSMYDHADVSQFIEAAENELVNMSVNFSMLEKSIVTQSFDVSRRFSILPTSEDVHGSSLLNPSYSPIFNFANNKQHEQEVERLRNEIVELTEELEKAKMASMRLDCQSPAATTSSATAEAAVALAQQQAARNFEELEMCRATLAKVEAEKRRAEKEHEVTVSRIGELEAELTQAMRNVEEEREKRRRVEEVQRRREEEEPATHELLDQLEARLREREDELEHLKLEFVEMESREMRLREEATEANTARSNLYMRVKDAEAKIEHQLREIRELTESMTYLTEEVELLRQFEREQTSVENRRRAAVGAGAGGAQNYARSTQTEMSSVHSRRGAGAEEDVEEEEQQEARESLEIMRMKRDMLELRDLERRSIEGIEKVQGELSQLIEKTMKVRVIYGNVSTIQLACEEMCKRLDQERRKRHEQAVVMKKVNDTLEKQAEAAATLQQRLADQENVAPKSVTTTTTTVEPAVMTSSTTTTMTKYSDPTRQLLHDSTMAVDAIVQKLKKTQQYGEMNPKLKAAIAQIITESRGVRDFLHQKLTLFKSIDIETLRNHTYEELLQRLEKSYQDLALMEQEYRKVKKEMKAMKHVIPTLGADVEERIKKEIGGIARDMGSLKATMKK